MVTGGTGRIGSRVVNHRCAGRMWTTLGPVGPAGVSDGGIHAEVGPSRLERGGHVVTLVRDGAPPTHGTATSERSVVRNTFATTAALSCHGGASAACARPIAVMPGWSMADSALALDLTGTGVPAGEECRERAARSTLSAGRPGVRTPRILLQGSVVAALKTRSSLGATATDPAGPPGNTRAAAMGWSPPTELDSREPNPSKSRIPRGGGWWSWRESNPRPRASNQVFSGCSQCCRFLSPGARTDTSPTDSVRMKSRPPLLTESDQQAF